MSKAVLEDARINGLTFSLTLFDNRRSAAQTSVIARQIAKEKYDVVIGTRNSSEALPAAKIFNTNKIPFFVPNATHPDVTNQKPYVVRLVSGDKIQAQVLAAYAVKKFTPETIAIVVNVSRSYSLFLAEAFERSIKRLSPHIKIVTLEMIDGYKDYKKLIGSLLQERADLVFLPLINPRVGHIYKEIAETTNESIHLLGGDGVGGRDSFFRLIGRTSKHINFYFIKHWNGYFSGHQKEKYQRLYERYCENTHKNTFFTVAGYDMTNMLVTALFEDESLRGANLVQKVKQMEYEGLLGRMNFDREGDTIKPFHIYRIVNNTLEFQETVTLNSLK